MPWHAVPFSDRATKDRLSSTFGVRGIPTLVLIDEQGNLMTTDGRAAIRHGYPFRAPDEAKPEEPWLKDSQYEDLQSALDASQATCLNANDDHPVQAIWKQDQSFLQSDADEQLLLAVPFKQPVNIFAVGLEAPTLERAPSELSLFINKDTMDFSDTESAKVTEKVKLSQDDWTEVKTQSGTAVRAVIKLKYVKFQNINSLTIFVSANVGDEEESQLTRVRVFGKTRSHTNMKNWGT